MKVNVRNALLSFVWCLTTLPLHIYCTCTKRTLGVSEPGCVVQPCLESFPSVQPSMSKLFFFFLIKIVLDSFWFTSTGVDDMFFPSPYNLTLIQDHCTAAWHVVQRPYWLNVEYGMPDFQGASNIVFSSGKYDPWSSAGIMEVWYCRCVTVVFCYCGIVIAYGYFHGNLGCVRLKYCSH